jgi:hypothetical protein
VLKVRDGFAEQFNMNDRFAQRALRLIKGEPIGKSAVALISSGFCSGASHKRVAGIPILAGGVEGRHVRAVRALADAFGHGAKSGSEAQAAAFGDVVALATRHEAAFDAMHAAGGRGAFAGKVLLDINNPVPNVMQGDFLVSVHPEMADCGSGQGRSDFATAGVVRLRRGLRRARTPA